MPSSLPRRSATFARSDVHSAAEQFVEALAEHADVIWDEEVIADLADDLTDRAFVVLRDHEAGFGWTQ